MTGSTISYVGVVLIVVLCSRFAVTDATSICSAKRMPVGSNFKESVEGLVAELARNTPTTNYVYSTFYTVGNSIAYGEASCQWQVMPAQCEQCIRTIAQQAWTTCGYCMGARVQQTDCYARFEDHQYDGFIATTE